MHDEKWFDKTLADFATGNGQVKHDAIEIAKKYCEHMVKIRPAAEYKEKYGDVLWFQEMPTTAGTTMVPMCVVDAEGGFAEDHSERFSHFQIIHV